MVGVPELDPNNATDQAEKQTLFEKLHSPRGLLQFVLGSSGKRTGLGYALTPQGRAELELGPMSWSSAPCRPRIAPDQSPDGASTSAPRAQLVKKITTVETQ